MDSGDCFAIRVIQADIGRRYFLGFNNGTLPMVNLGGKIFKKMQRIISASLVGGLLAAGGLSTFAHAQTQTENLAENQTGSETDSIWDTKTLDPNSLGASSGGFQNFGKSGSGQTSAGKAVDGFNFVKSKSVGTIEGAGTYLSMYTFSTALPYFSSFAIQGDIASGRYGGTRADKNAAAALHICWRDPSVGMVGLYGDWGYLSPIHSGRLGVETAYYNGQRTFEGLFATEFGQNVYTKFVDEIDISYYLDDITKVSVGHRLTARGNAFNIGFEKDIGESFGSQLSFFSEVEMGDDDNYQAFAGIRASKGSAGAKTLMARDRSNIVRIRIPRNLASVTQCADLVTPFAAPSWLTDIHLIKPGSETETLCASNNELNKVPNYGVYKP